MKGAKILLITEANVEVASGHLLESIELLDILREKGHNASLFVNDDAPEAFRKRINGDYYLYHISVEQDVKKLCDVITSYGYDLIITNLRNVRDEWIRRIKESVSGLIVCIDEWGHRDLSCDVIINPMIDPYYWDYGNSDAKLYTGQEYLILPEKIREYHQRELSVSDEIRNVCISMGGVDRFGSTLKIVKVLISNFTDIYIDIVLGGGFPYVEELMSIVSGKSNIEISQNISDIYEHFIRANIAFCAGGNTLHELACIGIPAIVIPTADHEINNGKAFGCLGFGLTLNKSNIVTDLEIQKALELMQDPNSRKQMMLEGKKICSGEGRTRVVQVIEDLI